MHLFRVSAEEVIECAAAHADQRGQHEYVNRPYIAITATNTVTRATGQKVNWLCWIGTDSHKALREERPAVTREAVKIEKEVVGF